MQGRWKERDICDLRNSAGTQLAVAKKIKFCTIKPTLTHWDSKTTQKVL